MLRPLLLTKLLLVTSVCTLHIVLLAYDRPAATERCLASLANVRGRTAFNASLEVRVDRLHDGSVNKGLLTVVESFNWPHGSKYIYIQPRHVGLRQQWLSIAPHDVTLIVEDDLILAPSYPSIVAEALKWWQTRSMTGQGDYPLEIFAISLQKPQWQMGRNEHGRWRRLDLLRDEHPAAFTFQAPSTWGLVVTPTAWKRFTSWSEEFLRDDNRNYTTGAVTTKWIRERGEMNLISPLMFEYLIRHHQTILYFWLGESTSIAVAKDPEGPYMRDHLLDGREQLHRLLGALRASLHLPNFSVCHDSIHVDSREGELLPFFKLYYDAALLDERSLRTVIASLVNSCRKPRIRVVRGTYAKNPQVRPPGFSCPQGSAKAHEIFEQVQNNSMSISCNYSAGLYPDAAPNY